MSFFPKFKCVKPYLTNGGKLTNHLYRDRDSSKVVRFDVRIDFRRDSAIARLCLNYTMARLSAHLRRAFQQGARSTSTAAVARSHGGRARRALTKAAAVAAAGIAGACVHNATTTLPSVLFAEAPPHFHLTLSIEELETLVAQFHSERQTQSMLAGATCATLVGVDLLMVSTTGILGALVAAGCGVGYVWAHLEPVDWPDECNATTATAATATATEGRNTGGAPVVGYPARPAPRKRFIDCSPTMMALESMLEAHRLRLKYAKEGTLMADTSPEAVRVQVVGAALVAASGVDLPAGCTWRFTVLDADEANAFVLPSGDVFVYRGLLDALPAASDLAVVLAHEVAHVRARHSAERLSIARFPALLKGCYFLLVLCGMVPPLLPGEADATLGTLASRPFPGTSTCLRGAAVARCAVFARSHWDRV